MSTMSAEGEEILELLANDLLDLENMSEQEKFEIISEFPLITSEVEDRQYAGPQRDTSEEQNDNDDHEARFRTVSDEDCDRFIKENENKNTLYKTRSDIKLFNEWKCSIGEQREITEIPPPDLDNLLARFFLAIRKQDGSEYEPGTLMSIQYSIDRYLKENHVNFSIKKDTIFSHSNNVLLSKRKNLKSQGKGNLKKKADPLTAEEFQSLREQNLVGKDDPETLLHSVWLNNGVHFVMRGRQDHTNLLWGDIELKRSPDGREYLEYTERSTKTRNGSSRNSNRAVAPKLFAQPDNELCPVTVYKEYQNRRPADMLGAESRFYLQPPAAPKTNVWFSHQPVGKNKLGNIMKVIA